MEKEIKQRFIESALVIEKLANNYTKEIKDVVNDIVKAYRKKGKVVLMGNGGSAAQCSHIAAEFTGRYEMNRPSLEAIALTTDISALTAIANDFGYDKVFERQVESIVKKKDIVIGLTTSGNSPNVLRGLERAKNIGATTLAFTGEKGLYVKIQEPLIGVMERPVADYVIKVPSVRTSVIQEAHIAIGHIICEQVEKKLFGKKK